MVAATKRNRQQRSQGEEPKENEMSLGPRQLFMIALHNYLLNPLEHLSIVILLEHLIFSDVKIPSEKIYIKSTYCFWKGFTPGGTSGKEPGCQNRTLEETWVPSLGGKEPLEKGTGNPLQYSCLENSMDRGTWRATVHGVAKSRT